MQTIIICLICRDGEELCWNDETNNELIKHNLCFNCNFWREKIEWWKEGRADMFVINGIHYHIAPDHVGSSFVKGFGGSKFIIQPLDGRGPIVSKNVWCQGHVPERFKNILTDNAKFIIDGAKEFNQVRL